MALGKLFRRDPLAAQATALYRCVVDQARRPEFYGPGGVPDTVDGRFELIGLHAFLLLQRLRQEGETGAGLSQAVVDAMFADLDASLREMGAGDLGVPPRVKRMASGFFGRLAAYEAGLAGPDPVLAEAVQRNLYGTVAPAPAAAALLAAYMRRAAGHLAAQPGATILAGRADFPPLGA